MDSITVIILGVVFFCCVIASLVVNFWDLTVPSKDRCSNHNGQIVQCQDRQNKIYKIDNGVSRLYSDQAYTFAGSPAKTSLGSCPFISDCKVGDPMPETAPVVPSTPPTTTPPSVTTPAPAPSDPCHTYDNQLIICQNDNTKFYQIKAGQRIPYPVEAQQLFQILPHQTVDCTPLEGCPLGPPATDVSSLMTLFPDLPTMLLGTMADVQSSPDSDQ